MSKEEGSTREVVPQIINELNKHLGDIDPKKAGSLSVEGIARNVGISKNILYEWVKTDREFSDALERWKNIQENDPFRTGTVEDNQVNAMTIILLLLETRDRHYKLHNI
jgi:DNA-packaging protein gp3